MRERKLNNLAAAVAFLLAENPSDEAKTLLASLSDDDEATETVDAEYEIAPDTLQAIAHAGNDVPHPIGETINTIADEEGVSVEVVAAAMQMGYDEANVIEQPTNAD